MAAFSVLVSSSFTMKWDMMNQFLPCRYFISECLHHNIFPLWCPYINFGYPFFADPQSGVFYPFTWFIAFTSGYNVNTIGLEYVLHVAIAGIAFFYLLKSFELDNYTCTVFGLIYCLSGVFIGNAQHLPWIISMAWMPLILLNFKNLFIRPDRKNAISLALYLYLAITGGYPGFFIILFYFFLLYGIVKIATDFRSKGVSDFLPVALYFTLAGVVFVLLTGGYLYSFTHSLPHIARGKPVTLTEANNVALTPRSMVSFFFPFATTAASFKLDTDISMANIYCGFLLLPLLFIALVKIKLQYFHKAVFSFAVICLLAAAGKYFYVRTLLYNFLPGMNMLRHAAIFRVFTMFGFVFLAANGFDWVVNAIRNKTDSRFIKGVFSGWLLVLLLVYSFAVYKGGFNLPVVFNTISLADFNAHGSTFAHISAQLFFQIGLLIAFVVVLFLQIIPANTRVMMLSGITVLEIFISVQLNLPATVVSDVSPRPLQAKLDQLSAGFPVPALNPMGSFTHYSDGSTLPIWYNISFFKKIPAKDGFNSFYLQNVDDLNASSKLDSFLNQPVVFFKNPDTKFEFTRFEPNSIVIRCHAKTADRIYLQQNYYEGWTVFTDEQESLPQHELCSMNTSVPAGEHTVHFQYQQKPVKYLFLLSAITAGMIISLLAGAKIRQALN